MVVAVSFVSISFAKSLLYFGVLLLAFSFFEVVVVVVVPIAAIARAFVVLSFALAPAFVSFVVVPCCSYVHQCWSLLVVAAWCGCLYFVE